MGALILLFLLSLAAGDPRGGCPRLYGFAGRGEHTPLLRLTGGWGIDNEKYYKILGLRRDDFPSQVI